VIARSDAPVSPRALPIPAEGESPAGRLSRAAGLLLALGGVLIVAMLSLRIGSLGIETRDAWNALFHYDPTNYDELVVRTLRLPRTVIALAVGAGLAVAGTTSQAVTRNPLADPAILGVSSGAGFAVVLVVFYLGLTATSQYVWFAFVGALLASGLVFAVASAGRGGATPVKLALAGVVISSLLAAWTSALLLLDEATMDVVRFWLAGSVAGRDLGVFWAVAPFLLGGTLLCLFLGNQLNVMSLGEETARALGMNTARTRLIAAGLVVAITGAAVAAAGPIAFVGLATPHVVRSVVGPDYRWVLPYSALVGAIFLTGADVLGRVVAKPGEVQVGIVTAIVGAPFLIYLARRRSVAN
jgi:iron complex transport system permease protein